MCKKTEHIFLDPAFHSRRQWRDTDINKQPNTNEQDPDLAIPNFEENEEKGKHEKEEK